MGSLIISCSIAGAMLLLAVLFSILIQHSAGVNSAAPKKRKAVFWIFCILNPIMALLLGYFVFRPDADLDYDAHESYMGMFYIGLAVGFVLYIIVGFILAKMFKNGKIGNWF